MDTLVPYSLPIQGLKKGVHQYTFEVGSTFFAQFEDSPVEDGLLSFEVILDKRPDMLLLDFKLAGHVKAECDRCTAEIEIPLEDERQLIVKFSEEEIEAEDEVVFIKPDASAFNVAPYLYEFVVLALPIRNIIACEQDTPPPCNFDVLKRLKTEESEALGGSIWESLKDFKNDN